VIKDSGEPVPFRQTLENSLNEDGVLSLLSSVPKGFRIKDKLASTQTRGAHALLDLLDCYRTAVPDLNFKIEPHIDKNRDVQMTWSASGRHLGYGYGVLPTGRHIVLTGRLSALVSRAGDIRRLTGTWDIEGFLRQVGISVESFQYELNLPSDAVRIRSIVEKPGVPLLLFPAMSLPGWTTWKPFIETLRTEQPLVTFQLIGNRRALREYSVPKWYSMSSETQAIEKALRRSTLEGPFFDILGHSIGGALALDFALNNNERVRSLTLIEPVCPWILGEPRALDPDLSRILQHRRARYPKKVTDEAYIRFLRNTMGRDYVPEKSPHWPVLRIYRDNLRFRPAIYSHSDNIDRVKSATFPVLLVGGYDSSRCYKEMLRALAVAFPHAHLEEMDGAHAPHYRNGMPRFLQIWRHFHKEHAQAGSSK
jgi:pimeloyl-ACP methyl ester carboxylesterase